MHKEIQSSLESLIVARLLVAECARLAESESDAAHLRGLLTGAMQSLAAADVLLIEAASAAKFLEVRKAHGIT